MRWKWCDHIRYRKISFNTGMERFKNSAVPDCTDSNSVLYWKQWIHQGQRYSKPCESERFEGNACRKYQSGTCIWDWSRRWSQRSGNFGCIRRCILRLADASMDRWNIKWKCIGKSKDHVCIWRFLYIGKSNNSIVGYNFQKREKCFRDKYVWSKDKGNEKKQSAYVDRQIVSE